MSDGERVGLRGIAKFERAEGELYLDRWDKLLKLSKIANDWY